MDEFRSSDAELSGIVDDGAEDGWDDELVGRLSEDLKDAFVKPIDNATQSKHLAAIAGALDESNRQSPSPGLPQPHANRSWSASGAPYAGAGRVNPPSSNAGLSSPFGPRRTTPAAAPSPARPRIPVAPPHARPRIPVVPPAPVVSIDSKQRKGSRFSPVELLNSMSSKAAAVIALIGLSSFGLAVAGQLPKPVQTAFSQAGDRVGLDIPAPIDVPQELTPAPGKVQTVTPPAQVVLPQPAPPPSPQPVPSYVPQDPALNVQPTTTQQASPAPLPTTTPAAGDFQSWLNEMIRQAITTANMYGTTSSPAPQPSQTAGATKSTSQQYNPYATYGTSSGSGSGSSRPSGRTSSN